MKLSTKGRYGVRFMLDLALHQDTGCMTLKKVAAHQKISEKYLWQVIHPLKAAGLIRAVRGARGGYALTRPPSRISVWDIVSTLEGKDLLAECVNRPDECESSGMCVARKMWAEMQSVLSKAMRSVTLENLKEKQKAGDKLSPNYSI